VNTKIVVSFSLARKMIEGGERPSEKGLGDAPLAQRAAWTLMSMINPRFDHRLSMRFDGARLFHLTAATECKGTRVRIEGQADTWWGVVANAYLSAGTGVSGNTWNGAMNQEAAKAATAVYAAQLGLQELRLNFDFRDKMVALPIDGVQSRWPIETWLDRMDGVGPKQFLDWFWTEPLPAELADFDRLTAELDRMELGG
jgi:hypothetical protein